MHGLSKCLVDDPSSYCKAFAKLIFPTENKLRQIHVFLKHLVIGQSLKLYLNDPSCIWW